ncbi:MAG TPA: hypothetical protein EYP67_08040 [Methanosarcinales archaeon]|nr:hypothetical protein [Methanosarcinales archaeon]
MKPKVEFAVVLGIALFCQPVLANPGISVSIEVIDKITGGADLSAEYKVKCFGTILDSPGTP